MPHKCVSCGNVFEDGSDEIFDGCPDCGGNKFMFAKEVEEKSETSKDRNVTKDRDVGEIIEAGPEQIPATDSQKTQGNLSQSETTEKREHGFGRDNQDGDEKPGSFEIPDPDELREELKDQFETIKIVEPGAYELNLMNLYDKDQKIIALQEDGKYQVSLPSAIQEDSPS